MPIKISGITWLGIRTEKFEEMKHFFGKLLNLPQAHDEPGFAVYDFLNGDRVELFAPNYPDHEQFTTGPVIGFQVEDIQSARATLEKKGIKFIGPIFGNPQRSQWSHFQGPDGNIYELTNRKKNPIATTFIVAGVVIKKDGKYLLVQERSPQAYGLWNLPAGKVEKGSTIEETAIREAKEETGFDVTLKGKLGVFHEEITTPVKHAFEAKIVAGKLQIPENELLDVRWFTYQEIQNIKEKLRTEWVLGAINLLEKPV